MIRTSSSGTPRPDLAPAYYEFARDPAKGYIVLPTLPVPNRDGRYFMQSRKEWYGRQQNVKRAPKGDTSRSESGSDSDTYTVLEYTHGEPVDHVESEQWSEVFNLEDNAARRTARVIELEAEIDAAAAVFNDTAFPASGSTGATVGTAWTTAATATPISDLITGCRVFADAWGEMPNAVIMDWTTYIHACATTDVKSRFLGGFGSGGGVPGVIPAEAFTSLLNIPGIQLILAMARYDSANSAVATPTMAAVWATNRVMITRIGMGTDLDGPQIGRTFVPPGHGGVEMDEYGEPGRKSTIIRATRHLVRQRMKNAVGYMLRGTT
jgi:hypothetical protein